MKNQARGWRALSRAGLTAAGCIIAASVAYAYGGVLFVMPGMNQTELQSVLGPPDYIQVRGPQQAWQYCPHWFDRRDDLYINVWFVEGRVTHMRVYGDPVMGSCNDFLAAFRWEDVIEGDEFAVGLGK